MAARLRLDAPLLVLLWGVCTVATACGAAAPTAASRTPAPAGPTTPASVAGLNGARLGSLRNYTFTSVNSDGRVTMTWTGRVHSLTDWKVQTDSPALTTFDVHGHGWALAVGQREQVTLQTPQGVNHLFGEQAFAEQLVGLTRIAGIRVTTGAPCTVAGAAGITYHLQSPNASLVNLQAQACVQRSTGALLSYQSGVIGGSAANAVQLSGHGTSFTVTSIGGVGTIAAPAAPTGTPVPTPPSALPKTDGLPPGFPERVPAPPGRITSSARLSATKWTLQLSEPDTGALAAYEQALEKQGFAVTSHTNSAAADIAALSGGTVSVLLEQMSLPGQGVILVVTVAS